MAYAHVRGMASGEVRPTKVVMSLEWCEGGKKNRTVFLRSVKGWKLN